MSVTAAIVQLSGETSHAAALADEFKRHGLTVTICSEKDARGAVRWAVDLSPESASACVVIDSDAKGTAALLDVLDPAIRLFVWAPNPAQPQRLALLLGQSQALVSLAETPELAAKAFVYGAVATAGADAPTAPSDELQTSTRRSVEDIVPPAVTPPLPDDDEDLALLNQLEQMMAIARTTTFEPPEPVQVQPEALDFSVPLRGLMTAARQVAQERRAPEVLPVHYLAGVAEQNNIYTVALAESGIDQRTISRALDSLVTESDEADEPVISDAVFDTVSLAKTHARADGADCVRVYDFLTALFEEPTPAVEGLLRGSGATAEGVLNHLRNLEPMSEPVGQPFFMPSSRDQAGFYEFNEAQVQDVASRLRKLPAFQKAAKPVKPKRQRKESIASPEEPPRISPVVNSQTPPPPDEPEIFHVNGDFPSVDVVEQAADLLLEGHLVAFSSDIMLALAGDGTNPAAVKALREAAGIPPEKPIGILINSTAQLKHLARADLDRLEPLFDGAWPGSLTLVFEAALGVGQHLTHDQSIAVRQPADSLSLAILSMLGRPLAVTSWDDNVADLTGKVAAVLKAGEMPAVAQTTVVDVRQIPWQIVREGAVPAAEVLKHQPDA